MAFRKEETLRIGLYKKKKWKFSTVTRKGVEEDVVTGSTLVPER